MKGHLVMTLEIVPENRNDRFAFLFIFDSSERTHVYCFSMVYSTKTLGKRELANLLKKRAGF